MTEKQLARALKRLQLNQTQAAEAMKSDRTAVWRWLHGQRRIPGPVEALVLTWLRCPESMPPA